MEVVPAVDAYTKKHRHVETRAQRCTETFCPSVCPNSFTFLPSSHDICDCVKFYVCRCNRH